LSNVFGDPNTKSNRVLRRCFEGRQIILGRSGRTSSAAIGHQNIIFVYIWPDRS
jgi:hypothetical protein